MRILWVTTRRFLPVTSGGSIRTANTLRELRLRHSITVFSGYRASRPEPGFEALLRSEFPGSSATYCGPSPGWLANSWKVVQDLAPGQVLSRPYARTRKVVEMEMRSGKYDIAVFDFLDSTDLAPRSSPIPRVLFEHNVESDLLRDHAALSSSWHKRMRTRVRALGVRNVEQAMVRRFDHTIAVSAEDARRFRALAGHARVTEVPTGADVHGLRRYPLPAEDRPVVVFTGLMNYQPNEDAVAWFCAEIWPRITKEVPAARFVIAGKHPSEAVRRLAGPSVEVTGEVPDMSDQFRRATVAVVPLRVGSGTRLKVYEAMACGRPVVSTRLGSAGLDVGDGRDIVLADTEAEFARAVVRVLTDREWATRLAEGAVETAQRQSWERATEAFELVLVRVANVR